MAQEAWADYGLLKWSVVNLAPESGYSVQTVITWESPECVSKAMNEAGSEVMADRKNFTTEQPVVVQGVVAAGTMA